MSEPAGEAKLELKQASKEAKESENVAEKYSAMTVSKNSEVNMGELSPAFSAVPTHKPVKKVRPLASLCKSLTSPYPKHCIQQTLFICFVVITLLQIGGEIWIMQP